MTDPLDLDALGALDAAATPAPWTTEHPEFIGGYIGHNVKSAAGSVVLFGGFGPMGGTSDAQAAIAAAARNALPALIDRVRELEARIDAVRALMPKPGSYLGSAGVVLVDDLYAALDGDA